MKFYLVLLLYVVFIAMLLWSIHTKPRNNFSFLHVPQGYVYYLGEDENVTKYATINGKKVRVQFLIAMPEETK